MELGGNSDSSNAWSTGSRASAGRGPTWVLGLPMNPRCRGRLDWGTHKGSLCGLGWRDLGQAVLFAMCCVPTGSLLPSVGAPGCGGHEESPCLALWGSSPSVSLMSTDTVNERDGGQPLPCATGVALSLDQSRALHRPGRAGHQDGEVQGARSCLRLSTGTLSTFQAQQLHPLSQGYPTA